MKAIATLVIFLLFLKTGYAQVIDAHFSVDSLRLESDSKSSVDTAVSIVVPSGQSIQNVKIEVAIDKEQSTVDLGKLRIQNTRELIIKNASDSAFKFFVTIPRHTKDDRILKLQLKAFDSTGKNLSLSGAHNSMVIYLKPQQKSLSNNKAYECWFFTGTNFDPFNGAKPQEFFFRANTIFKASKRLYGQIAFYKNRYFTVDSSSIIDIIEHRNPYRYINGTDTTYISTKGSYQSNVKQKIDPVGIQFDLMYKLTKGNITDNSTFFATAGFDVSTKYVTLENTFSNFDTTTVIDTIAIGRNTGIFPKNNISISYQKPVYNFSLGFMWIYDSEEINIKAHLNGGLSRFSEAKVILNPRGGTGPAISEYTKTENVYFQARMFATIKKPGLSLGFESFIRKSDFPQFNFTLAKVFDLKNILSVLTPVSSLNL